MIRGEVGSQATEQLLTLSYSGRPNRSSTQRLHELALSEAPGRGALYVPLSNAGMTLYLAGSLKRTHRQFQNLKTYDVEVRTLDEFRLPLRLGSPYDALARAA
jgi:hypothetical protein